MGIFIRFLEPLIKTLFLFVSLLLHFTLLHKNKLHVHYIANESFWTAGKELELFLDLFCKSLFVFCFLSSPHDFTHGFPTDKNVKSNSLSPLTICFSTVTNSRSNVMYIYKTTVPLRSTVQWKDTYSYSSQNIFNNPSLYEYQNLDPVDLELNLKP